MLHTEKKDAFSCWWYREDVTHVSFFSERTIKTLAVQYSLSIISIKNSCEIVLKKQPCSWQKPSNSAFFPKRSVGVWRSWLSRRPVKPEIAGSIPVTPDAHRSLLTPVFSFLCILLTEQGQLFHNGSCAGKTFLYPTLSSLRELVFPLFYWLSFYQIF